MGDEYKTSGWVLFWAILACCVFVATIGPCNGEPSGPYDPTGDDYHPSEVWHI